MESVTYVGGNSKTVEGARVLLEMGRAHRWAPCQRGQRFAQGSAGGMKHYVRFETDTQSKELFAALSKALRASRQE